VYNYFPTLTDLVGACITDTTSRAPAVGPKTLAGASDPERRFAALVPALFARYRFLAPWLRWSQHEAHLIPELGAFHARFREQHLQLIRDAIAPRGGGRAPAAAVGLAEVLTRYSSWETLTKDQGLSDDQAVAAVLGIAAMDRLIVLERGRVVEEGYHRSLLARDGLYARLWAHQSGGEGLLHVKCDSKC